MCWAACDRLAKIAGILDLSERVSHWRTEATRIRATILDKAWDPEQNTFVESLGGKTWMPVSCCCRRLASSPRRIRAFSVPLRRERRGSEMAVIIFRYSAPSTLGRPRV